MEYNQTDKLSERVRYRKLDSVVIVPWQVSFKRPQTGASYTTNANQYLSDQMIRIIKTKNVDTSVSTWISQ